MNGLSGNMTPLRPHSKPVPHGKTAWTHDARDIRLAGWPSRDEINDLAPAGSPIPICSQINNCVRDELWTNESWLVDGLATQLRGFRKSHQLIRDKPALVRGSRRRLRRIALTT